MRGRVLFDSFRFLRVSSVNGRLVPPESQGAVRTMYFSGPVGAPQGVHRDILTFMAVSFPREMEELFRDSYARLEVDGGRVLHLHGLRPLTPDEAGVAGNDAGTECVLRFGMAVMDGPNTQRYVARDHSHHEAATVPADYPVQNGVLLEAC